MFKKISSLNNKLVKELTKLKQKKYRQENGLYVIEGFHLVTEALNANEKYEYLLGTEEALAKIQDIFPHLLTSMNTFVINSSVAHHLASTKNSQDIFMVLKITQPQNYHFNFGKWVLLDHLADPGNVGTIIRTADAAGFDGVVLSPESVDIYNPKTQRAMQGSQFHIKLVVQDLINVIKEMQDNAIPIYSSMLDRNARKLQEFVKVPQVGIVIGNEAHGVTSEIAKICDQKLYIPIKGKAESLNAAVAAGIIVYYFS